MNKRYKRVDLPSNRMVAVNLPEGLDFIAEGWECPVCGRGNSPALLTCPCFEEKNNNGRLKG